METHLRRTELERTKPTLAFSDPASAKADQRPVPHLSIVASMYRSQGVIEEFVRRVSVCAREISADYEIVLVNDGCPAGSLQVAYDVLDKYPKVKLVDLSRNFGHHAAMRAGLTQAEGQLIYLTNIDLEERPENLRELWRVWSAYTSTPDAARRPVDVFYGMESARKGSFIKRVMGAAFYPIFNFLSGVTLPKGQIVSRLMSRRYVDSMLQFSERDIFMPALWELAGFTQKPVPLDREESQQPSTYNMRRRIDLAVRAITSFSSKPLLLIFYLGTAVSIGSAIVIAALLINKFVFGGVLSGWTSLLVSLFLLNGLVIFSIGVIGIYLSRMFMELKARPVHIIRSVEMSKVEALPEVHSVENF